MASNTTNDILLGLQIATAIAQARGGSHEDQYDAILTTFDVLSIRIPALRNDPVFAADLRKAVEDVLARRKARTASVLVLATASSTAGTNSAGSKTP